VKEKLVKVEPQKEHHWLSKLVGDWTFEGEAQEPGKPPQKSTGKESVRSLGGVWIIGEGEAEMPGEGAGRWVITLGYDPQKKRFVGSWVGSMMTNMWVYDGALDESEKVLTLDSEGPSMKPDGGMSKYRDIIEIKSGDHRTLTGQVLGEDGKWQTFMTAQYKRKK
jgi:hypothetical protein